MRFPFPYKETKASGDLLYQMEVNCGIRIVALLSLYKWIRIEKFGDCGREIVISWSDLLIMISWMRNFLDLILHISQSILLIPEEILRVSTMDRKAILRIR